MILYAIPVAAAIAAGAYTCTKGVEVKQGTVPFLGEWRLKWACWRYKAEIKRKGSEIWEGAGSARKAETALVGAVSKLAVGPGGVAVTAADATPGPGMVRMVHGKVAQP